MNIGILGGGQLARMLALAGYPLGLRFTVLDPAPDACAAHVAAHLQGAYDDEKLLARLAEETDVVTYEFENVPAHVAEFLSARTRVYPPAQALAVGQDRWHEKTFFQHCGVPAARCVAVASLAELAQAMDHVGWPALLKTRTQGYDGKGQVRLTGPEDLAPAWAAIQGVPAVVEAWVPFSREVSIIAARRPCGETVYYPLSENVHRGGILRVAQCRARDPLQAQAEEYMRRLLTELDYVGVLALELFVCDGELLANEFAPRVHNSGHWTIEGAVTSQFENHLRAILDWPLGATTAIGHAAMVNFIGGLPDPAPLLALPDTHLHLYGKSARKGRKVAHATVRTVSRDALESSLQPVIDYAVRCDDS